MYTFLPAFILIFVSLAAAQTKTFKWQTETCEFSGTYDLRKYTEAQLRDTAKLIAPGSFDLGIYTVWKYEDIARIDLAAVDRDFSEKAAALKKLNIINIPYWRAAREAKLKELEQRYRLTRTTLEAYTVPNALSEYRGAEECRQKYAEAVTAGGEKLLRAWRAVNIESRKNNADPERIGREFEKEFASPDRMKFALLEVMGFGWNNCAVRFIEHDERFNDGTHQAEFKKLFVRVKQVYCDEP